MIGKRSIVVHFVTALCYFVISRWIIRSIFYFSKVKYYPLSVSFWIPGVEWQMLNVTPQWDGASSVKCILHWYFVQIRFCPSQCVTAALSLSDTLELQVLSEHRFSNTEQQRCPLQWWKSKAVYSTTLQLPTMGIIYIHSCPVMLVGRFW